MQNSELEKGFSALQRAEIAEISRGRGRDHPLAASFSALQRAEIAEIPRLLMSTC